MKLKLLTIVIIILALLALVLPRLYKPRNKNVGTKNAHIQISPSPEIIDNSINVSLFIPYWQIPKANNEIYFPDIEFISMFQLVNYFAIKPGSDGVNKSDNGYLQLTKFSTLSAALKTDSNLVLAMTNTNQNLLILNDQKKIIKLIEEVIVLTDKYQFNGILVDLELSTLNNKKITGQVTEFFRIFNETVADRDIKLGLIVYGDVFYRLRPYDLNKINPYIDTIYLMAYDLHKTLGTPGPNFPLNGKEKFGTDLATTVDTITKLIDVNKVYVIFGLYGYDWLVDSEKRPIRAAKALPLNNIKANFIDKCVWKNCVISRDPQATENEINYVDDNGELHIVWYEDEQSVNKKIKYLKSLGIDNFSYWVWGYY